MKNPPDRSGGFFVTKRRLRLFGAAVLQSRAKDIAERSA
jgi:hypothetical protein